MLKRDITYEDFNEQTRTETFYFNLTKTEIIELEVDYAGGLELAIKRIIAAEDNKALLGEFKKIILLSYGVKSDDGKEFIKTDDLKAKFASSAAYDALFMELSTNENAAADFIKGVLPKDMQKAIAEADIQDKPTPPQLPFKPKE